MRKAEKRMRSAKAPVMSAGVMMANMHWKIMKTMCGRLVAMDSWGCMPTPARARKSRPPIRPLTSVPKDRE